MRRINVNEGNVLKKIFLLPADDAMSGSGNGYHTAGRFFHAPGDLTTGTGHEIFILIGVIKVLAGTRQETSG